MKVTKACGVCGRPFQARDDRYRYCSRSCGIRSRTLNRRRACEHCGKAYAPRSGRVESSRCCSWECWLHVRGSVPDEGQATKKCPQCGIEQDWFVGKICDPCSSNNTFSRRSPEQRERYRQAAAQRRLEARIANPEATRREYKNGNLKRYGLTIEDHDRMFEEQNGLCAICSKTLVSNRRDGVDHDHETGVVRGILCGNCNAALGHFKDSIETMEQAIAYVKRHKDRVLP